MASNPFAIEAFLGQQTVDELESDWSFSLPSFSPPACCDGFVTVLAVVACLGGVLAFLLQLGSDLAFSLIRHRSYGTGLSRVPLWCRPFLFLSLGRSVLWHLFLCRTSMLDWGACCLALSSACCCVSRVVGAVRPLARALVLSGRKLPR